MITKQRRLIEREFNIASLRELLKIPDDEMTINYYWDKDRNRIVLITQKDYDENQGDIQKTNNGRMKYV